MNLRSERSTVFTPNGALVLDKPILEVVLLDEKVVVIHDYMAYPQDRPAKNLVAYTQDGRQVWVADNPTDLPTDAYVNFISEVPLVVGNFAGFNCTISSSTGFVENHAFTK